MSRPDHIPIVAIVGRGDVGKTTVAEQLVAQLTAEGVRVAAVKHHPAASETDDPGTDSWRLAEAGAVAAMLATSGGLTVNLPREAELSLDEIADVARDAASAQILIAEGYKSVAPIRIEVVRCTADPTPVCTPCELVALVTDHDAPPPGYEGLLLLGLDDTEGLANLVRSVAFGAGGQPLAD